MRNFRKLNVYLNSMELVKGIYQATNSWPEKERFGLVSQITRAAVSFPSNTCPVKYLV